MRKTFTSVLCIFAFFFPMLAFSAASWTPPQTIQTPPTIESRSDVFLTYNSSTNQVFAAWTDTSFLPTYAIFDFSSGWSAPAAISSTFQTSENVFLSYKADTGQVFATWTDLVDLFPIFSIYTPGLGWSTPATIQTTPLSTVNMNVTTAYQSNTHQMFAIWGDRNDNSYPTYSIYTNGIGWSDPLPVNTASSVSCDVYLAYDSSADQMIATWGDSTEVPIYSVFDGLFWSTPGVISATSSVLSCVTQCYDGETQSVVAAWTDPSNNFLPTYAVYQAGSGWSMPSPISTVSKPLEDVFMTYDTVGKRIFAAWTDTENNFLPTYTIYSAHSWSPAALIATTSQSLYNVVLTYANAEEQVFATWALFNDNFPIWSVYQSVLPPPPPPPPPPLLTPLPPNHLKGVQKVNRFAFQSDYVNILTWKKSPSPNIKGYIIFRNGIKIAQVGPSTTRYEDHNRRKKKTYNYSVAAINTIGLVSDAVSVTVR